MRGRGYRGVRRLLWGRALPLRCSPRRWLFCAARMLLLRGLMRRPVRCHWNCCWPSLSSILYHVTRIASNFSCSQSALYWPELIALSGHKGKS